MQPTSIECDVHNLLDEANVLLLSGNFDAAKANDLVEKIRACARQARQAGWLEIEQRLLDVAEMVLTKLSSR